MSEPFETTPTYAGLKGASVGGVIGITVWQVLSGNLLDVGFVAGLLILTAYMALCMLLGALAERFMARK